MLYARQHIVLHSDLRLLCPELCIAHFPIARSSFSVVRQLTFSANMRYGHASSNTFEPLYQRYYKAVASLPSLYRLAVVLCCRTNRRDREWDSYYSLYQHRKPDAYPPTLTENCNRATRLLEEVLRYLAVVPPDLIVRVHLTGFFGVVMCCRRYEKEGSTVSRGCFPQYDVTQGSNSYLEFALVHPRSNERTDEVVPHVHDDYDVLDLPTAGHAFHAIKDHSRMFALVDSAAVRHFNQAQ